MGSGEDVATSEYLESMKDRVRALRAEVKGLERDINAEEIRLASAAYGVEVGPDRDGLGMVEIRSVCDSGEIAERIACDPRAALLPARAIMDCAQELTGGDDAE